MTTLKEWKERRPNYALIETVVFSHQSFSSPYRVATNQFSELTLGGNIYSPSSFTVTEDAQDGTASINMTVTFVSGAEDVRSIMKKWRGMARMSPISATYEIWEKPGAEFAMNYYTLYVKSITMDASNVTLTLSLTNPLTVGSNIIYKVDQYPGLMNL